MLKKIRSRYRYSTILLKEIVRTDFKLRYQGSFLGYLWSLLKPLAIFLIMYVVFLRFLKFNYGVPHTAVYLFVGIVFWSFFSEVTGGSVSSIVGKGDLLRKINFPKYVVVLAVSFGALINLGLNLVVVAIFMILNHVTVSWHILMVIPLMIELYIIALSIGFILSTLFVRYRDVNHIWDVVMQALFYAIPLFYPIQRVPLRYARFIMLNPMAQIIQGMRYYIVTDQTKVVENYWTSPYIIAIPLCIVAIIGVIAVKYFRSRSRFFAEEV